MRSDTKPLAQATPLDDPEGFREALIHWFRQDGRSYPWRETTDPYAIVVSELMLQQTQIATVLERDYYGRWMLQFPDVETLAAASEDAILKAWEGLGYYRRARNLQKLAQVVSNEHEGKFPETLENILALPGVGPYTAGAVLSFAFNEPVPLVDGNVHRVFARLFDSHEVVDSTAGQKQMWAWAADLVSPDHPRLYNSALMELGQTICRQKSSDCQTCPVNTFCQTRTPEDLPKKAPRRKTVFQNEHVLFQTHQDQLLLIQEQGKRRQGLWKLPPCPESKTDQLSLLYKAKYSITHHRVTLHVYASKELSVDDSKWHPLKDIHELAMPSPYRKAVDQLVKNRDQFQLEHR
ncbi:MAG: A/G-specific adenine glycosylase [Verrucomicrobiaceae bacterium]|nr:A/G-specific adenine glycosylase [Verrucomicrobiaceae bacterium]